MGIVKLLLSTKILSWASQTERKRTDEQKVMEKEHEMLKLGQQTST